MIKQNFNIDSDEIKRILRLHESATKNFYLLSEQEKIQIGSEKTTESKKFPTTLLGDKFEYGVYESPSVRSEIERLKPQIENFIKNSDSSSFVVNITAGESRVTNPENFKEKGSLALARANSVVKYFNEIFPDLIKSGVLVIKGPQSVKDVKIGETPYTKGEQNDPVKGPEFKKEQFVNFDISGTGSKSVESPIYKFICDTKPLLNQGGYLDADVDFTQIVPWKLNRGEGEIFIEYQTYYMPDVIYFEYNGKIYGDSMFHGVNADEYRIFIGTALRAKFGLRELPPQMGQNKIIGLQPNDKRIFDSLDNMKSWGMEESFKNTFGPKSSLKNENYMNAFRTFDRTGNKRRLINELGQYFPWGFLNSKMGPGEENVIGPIRKIDGIDEIKVYNVAPNGATKWKVELKCKSTK